jgi:hypothetical protein
MRAAFFPSRGRWRAVTYSVRKVEAIDTKCEALSPTA